MIAGLYYKNDKPGDLAKRKVVYTAVQDLAARSKALNGSIICRELLGLDHKSDEPTPEPRTEAYYKRRPCAKLRSLGSPPHRRKAQRRAG